MDKIFKDKKIVVMGLGLHGGGISVAKFFCRQGAKVLVTDIKAESQLQDSLKKLKGFKIEYVLGRHREEDFSAADLIVKNPDVSNDSPYLRIAAENNVPIETDLSLFFNFSKAFIIGVTGTKGKSTTSSLIFHFLKYKYKRIFLAGNIGISPLEIITKIKKDDMVVLELSSFGLENLKQSPNIAVITNLLPDHLNRYASMSEYANTKKMIFKYQDADDCLLLNKDDGIVREFSKDAKSKVYFYSKDEIPAGIETKKFRLFGNHNLANLSAAISVAKILGVSTGSINKSIKSFKGVPARQEFVKEANGVKYFNDTTATMPDAVVAAIESFSQTFLDSKLVFICGGQDKGLDFSELAEEIRGKSVSLVLLPGTASDKLRQELGDYKKIENVLSMEEAVSCAQKMSDRGDVVVLSPGAASFNLFKNEFDRGDRFVEFVKKIK